MNSVFVIGLILSMIFYGVILVGGVLFIRRTWNQIRAEGDGSVHMQLLDQVQRLEFQVEVVNDRLGRMERKLDALPSGASAADDDETEARPDPGEGDETSPGGGELRGVPAPPDGSGDRAGPT